MSKPATIPLSCLCSSFRRASRVLTQHYQTAMRSLGLKATQFTLLQALSHTGEVSQGRLGEILAIDSTTLTRTLAIMERRGWIDAAWGTSEIGPRIKVYSLTTKGRGQLRAESAQWSHFTTAVAKIMESE